jgi:hypothetical protein
MLAFMSLVPPLKASGLESDAQVDRTCAAVRQPCFLAQIGGVVKATAIGKQAFANNPRRTGRLHMHVETRASPGYAMASPNRV